MEAPEILPAPTPLPIDPELAQIVADREAQESLPVETPETETPPVSAGGFSLSDDEFQQRVTVVMAAIEDPEKMRRAIAEMHVLLFGFEQGLRDMQREMINSGGPMGMMRKMMTGKFGKDG